MTSRELLDLNRDNYNKIAEDFSATRAYIWDDIKVLLDYVGEGDSVLDVGCGNGRLVEGLKEKNVKYLGIDFSEKLIAEARKKYPHHEFAVVDLAEFHSDQAKYDVVFCLSVLNHFPKDFQEKIILNIKSALKPGGCLLMINWNLWNIKSKKSVWRLPKFGKFQDLMTIWRGASEQVKLYYYAFTNGEIRNLLNKTGFEVEVNKFFRNGRPSNWIFGRNIVTVARNIHPFLIKRKSNIQGVGIFALKDIAVGEEFYKIPLVDVRYKNYKRYAYVGNSQYVCDDKILNWVNHSCDPNTKLEIERLDPVLVALQNIKAGEEITCNYDFTEISGVYRVCHCGEENCRGSFGKK